MLALLLKDQELLALTKTLAQQERALTIALIEHLQEIHRRRLFADLGYSSLFDYLRKELGYSDAEAGVRVSSMKLIIEIPSAKEELAQGKISLTALSKASSSIRKQEKMTNEKVTPAEKEKILSQISGKSTRETELILKESELAKCQEKNITPPTAALAIQTQKIIVSDHVVKKICELKALKGNYTDSELLESLLDQELKKLAADKDNDEQPKHCSPPAPAPSPTKHTRHISVGIKRAVNQRAHNRCEFVDKKTGRRCLEVHHLQYDHLRPFSVNGTNDLDNISLRCQSHNLRSAIIFYGLSKMGPFINQGNASSRGRA